MSEQVHFVFFRDVVNRDRMYHELDPEQFARFEHILAEQTCTFDVDEGKICGEHLPEADADWVEDLRMDSDFRSSFSDSELSDARAHGRLLTVEYP